MPDYYDQHLVPVLFRPYAEDLVSRVPEGPIRVLELACGTGVDTGELSRRLGKGSELVATDFSPQMLALAQRNVSSDLVTFQQADAMDLGFPDKSFDVVVCQFGMMFFPDKVQGFREAYRVLKPGGKLLFNVWGSLADNPIFHTVERAIAKLLPDETEPIMPTPPNMADSDSTRVLVEQGGFRGATVSHVVLPVGGFPASQVASGFVFGTPFATFFAEKGIAPDEAHAHIAADVAHKLGEPISTTMLAPVWEAVKQS